MKLLGRQPTLTIALVGQAILLFGTFGLHWLSGQQATLIVVGLNALFGALNAWTVRPVSPAAFTYAAGSLIAVAGAYGLNIPVETVAAINAVVISALAFLAYGNVSPVETPVTNK